MVAVIFLRLLGIVAAVVVLSLLRKYNVFGMNILWRILQIVPPVLCVVMIMGFSSQTGEASSAISGSMAEGVLAFLHVQSPDYETVLMVDHILRKIAHMTEYGLLAFSLFAPLYGRPIPVKVTNIISVCLVFACAMVDEMNQKTVAARFGSFADVTLDTASAVLVVCVCYLFMKRNNSPTHDEVTGN